ncbi:MAG: hypothetical protein JWN13_6239 [Betaproteobacteria bacterium]|nr:hypothetical protein [Betaproteobacteria bacterium]
MYRVTILTTTRRFNSKCDPSRISCNRAETARTHHRGMKVISDNASVTRTPTSTRMRRLSQANGFDVPVPESVAKTQQP